MAFFNDSGCAGGGVCSSDPLLFTCELKKVALLQVLLPNGERDVMSLGDKPTDVNLPDGFEAASLYISPIADSTRNISLALSVANASLLDGGKIRCDNTTGGSNIVMAGCPLLNGKSQRELRSKGMVI